jgi:hypothetical protein
VINAIKIKLLSTTDDVQGGSLIVKEVLWGNYDDNPCDTVKFGGGT